ncbi:MAG: hypothetical protein AAFO77_05610 [Pseudomonadota bacterium]
MKKLVSSFLLCVTAIVGINMAAVGIAQAAFICKTAVVTGDSPFMRRSRAAKREAKADWEALAKSRFGFRYQWVLAKKAPGYYDAKSGGKTKFVAEAYPCRLTTKPGIVLIRPTPAQAACAGRPGLNTALALGCDEFYLFRN